MRAAALLVALIALGCSEDSDHPPVQACSGTQCHGPPVLGSGASTGSGVGGEGGSASGIPVFSVSRFESDDFLSTAPFTNLASVLADGEGGTTLEAAWNGLDPFAIEGLAEEPFVLVEPELGVDALPTMLRPALDGLVELPLVRATVLESILALSSQPLDLASDRAQVAITLIDVGTAQPISAATLAEPSAESVLYASSGTWSDADSETGPSGLAMLVNVEAGAWPGKLTSVAVTGSATGAIPLRVVSGAVTVLYVGIEL